MAVPPPAPSSSVDVLLRHGELAQLRPVTQGDESALRDLNAQLSPTSRRMRYFSAGQSPSQWYVDHLIRSARAQEALVALVGGDLVAVASYARLEADPGCAELAVLVADAHQDDGLGALLLEHLADQARRRGIDTFLAQVLGDNTRMHAVLRDSGLRTRSRTSRGVTELTIELADRPELHAAILRRELTAQRASLTPVLAPASVAVLGSLRAGTVADRVASSLRRSGFTGDVRRSDGRSELGGPVDLAVVAVPADRVLDAAGSAIASGARGIVVCSAGFAEVGGEGEARQARLLELCRDAGVRLVGPNCLGLLNTDPAVRLDVTFCDAGARPGRLALVSQSGAVGVAALRHARRHDTGLSVFVSIGNRADVSSNDLLAWLAGDERTSVIALYLESLGNPVTFTRLATEDGRHKPIVVIMAGRTDAGARAGRSHTAAATTPEIAMSALLHRAGVLRVDDMRELLDVVAVLDVGVLPRGPRLAVVGNSGGPGVLAADACAAAGLQLATLSPDTTRVLLGLAPPGAALADPVDLTAAATPQQLEQALVAVMADPQVDAVLSVTTPITSDDEEAFAAAVARAHEAAPGVLLIAAFPGVDEVPVALRGKGVPVFEFPEPVVQALGKVAAYAERAAAPAPEAVPRRPPGTRARAMAVLRRGGPAVDADRWLTPTEVVEVLQTYDVPVLGVVEVTDPDGAVLAAEALGLPVVLKATGPTLVHRTDVGGVRLDLATREQVHRAYTELEQLLGARMTGAVLQQQHPARGGLELLCGVSVDAQVGPLVMVAAGGVLTEVLDDRVVRLPAESREQAVEQVSGLRCARLFEGYRGRPPLDLDAVVDVVLALSAMSADLPELRELDLNPLLVMPSGALCLDARLRVGVDTRGLSARALSPRVPAVDGWRS